MPAATRNTAASADNARQPDPATQHAVQRFLHAITPRYPVAGAILYGSRARGTHAPDSDADLMVLLRGAPQRRMDVLLGMADSAYDAMLETGILISPLPVWESEMDGGAGTLNPALLLNISREGIRLA